MADEENLATQKLKLLAETRADLLKRQLSNAENYDKAILSLSTAFLGFSIAFLKDLLPVDRAAWLGLLYSSWVMLTGAVLTTIISFLVSQRAITVQLQKAEDYYLHDKQSALKRTLVAKLLDWFNFAAGMLFVFGVLSSTVFVIKNFERRSAMSKDRSGNQQLNEGAPIPQLQGVPLQKGAPVPNIQRLPQQTQPPAQTTPSTPPAAPTPPGSPKK